MGFLSKTANFVIAYIVVAVVLYVFGWLESAAVLNQGLDLANQILNNNASVEDLADKVSRPWTYVIIQAVLYLVLAFIAFTRGKMVGKAWLGALPIVAGVIGLFLSGLVVVSPALHLATIIVGAWPKKSGGDMPMAKA